MQKHLTTYYLGDHGFMRMGQFLQHYTNVSNSIKGEGEGLKKVETDANPFTEVESYFVDAKFYIENDAMEEVLPAIIPSTGKAKFERKV